METFQQDVKFIANKVLHRIRLSSDPKLTTGLLVALVILFCTNQEVKDNF